MQDLGFELPRIVILRTWVHKGRKKGRGQQVGSGVHTTLAKPPKGPQMLSQLISAPKQFEVHIENSLPL